MHSHASALPLYLSQIGVDKYNAQPAKHWDAFYAVNESNFFQERKWLHLEFPELLRAAQPDGGDVTILDGGCGTGSALFPLLSASQNPQLKLIGCDYSRKAIECVQANPLYLSAPPGAIRASVWDLASSSGLPEGVEPASVDILILIFVFSALHPDEWAQAVANMHTVLKPGGLVLLRDYGRHDMTQLRFKAGRLLDDNFYIRGDGTRVYFFELAELAKLFTGSPDLPQQTDIASYRNSPPVDFLSPDLQDPSDSEGAILQAEAISPSFPAPPALPSESQSTSSSSTLDATRHPLFSIDQLGVDRRLLVNRKRQLKMYRVWVQGKFRKIPLKE